MKRCIHAILCITLSLMLPLIAFAQAPVANFSANNTSGCSPIVTQFTDLSTNAPTSWYWDLGNGSTSTLQNPSTTYINPGTYTVVLTATNASGSNTKTVTSYITVTPSPVVSFTADSSLSCALPRTVTFTNNSVPGGSGTTTYFWDFGDGTTSTAQNPTKTYTTAGNYTVVLLVTNGNGCSKSLTKTNYIKVSQKPVISFTADNTSHCVAPATVNFTNTTTGASAYAWDFGDGGSSTATSPAHTYNASGNYTVRLIATNTAGCADTLTKTNYISITRPTAAFNASSTNCAGKNVTFTNTSSPSGYTSAWDFGDGNTSTANNPSKAYTAAGTYNVRLIVTRNGCQDTVYHTVTVQASPVAQFSGLPLVACAAPLTTNFTNSSTGASTYAWAFGDGNTSTSANPSNTYTSAGTFNVRLIATSSNGCSDTMTKSAYVKIQAPTATLSAGSYGGCVPVNVTYFANITTLIPVSGYSWDFGDGTSVVTCSSCPTQTHTYTSPGNYTVTLTYTTGAGCTFTKQTTISIGSKPTASFSATPTTICPGQTVTFTNTTTGASSYTWLFGDGGTSTQTNPAYNNYVYPPGGGSYTVMLIAHNNGCSDTAIKPNYITVNPPLAKFGVAYNCANRYQVTVTDSSVGANTYSWNWGDGNTSTQAGGTLSHTYAAAGTYTITLTVTNTASGCSHTLTRSVTVGPMNFAFTASDTTLCKSDVTVVTAVASGQIANYKWDFGDGVRAAATTNTMAHAYTSSGYFNVKLILTDINGCTDSVTKTNYMRVGGATVSYSANPTSGCLPLTVTFQDNSTPNGGFPITQRAWYYGYGPTTIGVGNTSTFTYTNGGLWSTGVYITDANGCVEVGSITHHINTSRPVAQFFTNDTIVCTGKPVVIYNNSGGNNFTCVWYWGDGNTSTQLTPTHTYTAPGTYTIKLVITDALGCKDSMTRTNYVKVEEPNISFTMSDTFASCPPLAVNFTNTSSSAANYTWTFGNGSQSTLSNPTTLYTYPGIYHVKLIGTSVGGCKDSLIKDVKIDGPTGTFTYSPTAGCNPVTVNFSASTVGTSHLIWDMSNGTTATTTASTYSYTYTQTGKYLPKLILSDGASCLVPVLGQDTIKVDFTDADFSFTPTVNCGTAVVQFKDTVLSTLSPVATRAWDFGDGGTSTAHNPTHNYTTSGNFNVRLIVTNTQGCSDTIIKTVVVNGLPSVTAGSNKSICSGSTTPVTLNASGAVSYSWTPFTGLSCTNCASPTALPSATTTYIVTGTDANGCTDTGMVTVTIANNPNVTAGPDVMVCQGASTTLTGYGATTYTWSPAGTLSCVSCVSTVASPAATTTYIVTGTDANGCSDTGMVTVTVNMNPTVGAGANQSICSGSATTLNATGATAYTWTPSAGLSCTNCANPVASPSVTTTYTVTGNLSGGCSNTASVTVTVNPKPTVGAGSNVTICEGASATLGGTGATSYTWSPSTGLSCTSCTNPVASPTTTTTYTVTGTNGNGCSNTATVTVTVNPKPAVSATATSTTICDGTTATLTGNGASTYTWTPTGTLSCASCTSPVASPAATTTYTVTGTDANGCSNTGTITITVNPKPTVSAGADQTICSGSSATLNASGATSYTWTPSTGLSCTNCASPVASPAATTTYTVTGTGANGCTGTASVVVTVNPKPSVSAGSNVAICIGGSTTLTGTGAASYTWSPSTGLSCTSCTSPVATPSATTTYTVTGTGSNGCTNTANVTVTVNAKPNVTASPNVTICNGTSATLTGYGAVTYIWTPTGSLSCASCTAPVASPTATTAYVVTGTDANGCTDTGNVTVTVNPKPTVTTGSNQVICPGGTVSLTASGASTYTWSPATGLSCTNCSNPSATPAATITYTVTGADANGCTNTATVTVTVNPKPPVSGGSNVAICSGASATLTGTGATSYTWSPSATLSCSNCASPVATPSATTTYTVTGTGANGCTNTANVTVTVNPLPVITATDTKTICEGESVQLNASGATTYSWTPPAGLSCVTCSNPVASPATTTTYTVKGTSLGCDATASVQVIVKPKPAVTAGGDKDLCIGSTVGLTATGAVSYSWSPATGLSCTACPNPNANPSTTTTYTISGTDADGCKNTVTVTVNVNPLPVIDAGPDQTICKGATAQLNATGGVSYTWSGGTQLSCVSCANPTVTPDKQTTYSVRGVDAKGCSNTDDVTISVIEKTIVDVGPGAEICKGESAKLHASGGTSYLWIPSAGLSDPNSPDPVATPDRTTEYKLVVKQGDCYADTNKVTVVVHDLPEVNAGNDVETQSGNTVQLLARTNMNVKYVWTPAEYLSCTDCASPVATPMRTITYTATVSNEWGCTAHDDVTIRVTCGDGQIFLANTFTPNNDGVNDVFYPQGKGINSVKSFKIYNRWGELLFSREDMPLNNPLAGWDGTYKGSPMKPDVFVYIIHAYCESGEPINLKGDISLVR